MKLQPSERIVYGTRGKPEKIGVLGGYQFNFIKSDVSATGSEIIQQNTSCHRYV